MKKEKDMCIVEWKTDRRGTWDIYLDDRYVSDILSHLSPLSTEYAVCTCVFCCDQYKVGQCIWK